MLSASIPAGLRFSHDRDQGGGGSSNAPESLGRVVPEGIRNYWSSKIEESVNAADSSWAVREAAIEKALLLGILDAERLSALKNLAFKDPGRYDELISELGWVGECIQERQQTLLAAKTYSLEKEIADLLPEAERVLFAPQKGERDVFDTLDSKVGCLKEYQSFTTMLRERLTPAEVDELSQKTIFDRHRAAKTVQEGVARLEAFERLIEQYGGVDQLRTAVSEAVERAKGLFRGQYLSLPDFGSYGVRLERMLSNREPQTVVQYRALAHDFFTIEGIQRELENESKCNRVRWSRED
jgi:hypothetical protein